MMKEITFREAMWNRYLKLCTKLVTEGLDLDEMSEMTTAFAAGAVGRDAQVIGAWQTHTVESVVTGADEHLFTLRSKLTKSVVRVTSDFVEVR